MYGLIGKITAAAGRRDDLARILLEGTGGMPGCLSYIVAEDPAEADALWITEVWDSQANHQASLKLPAVQAAIAKGGVSRHTRGRVDSSESVRKLRGGL